MPEISREPLVSILIPCYNAETWIAQCLESALGQSYSNKEIIVVDDGSTDNSLEIIKKFSQKIYFETQTNQGGNAARNRLLQLSQGDWIQYLDADDYLLPNKVKHHVDFVKTHPEVDIVFSPSIFEYVDSHAQTVLSQEVLAIPEPHDVPVLLARWYLPQTGSPLWRKQALLDIGGWKKDQPCCQEHELYLRLFKAGKSFQYCSDAESIYRQWSSSTVCKKDKPEVFRQRLLIEDDLEMFLQQTTQLTAERQYAINQARFECARQIWLFDPAWAQEVVSKIHRSDNKFVPSGDAAPMIYKWFYQRFNFQFAEMISKLKRTIVSLPNK